MKHPLKCPTCGDYRYIELEGVRFEDLEHKKGFGVKITFFICKHFISCLSKTGSIGCLNSASGKKIVNQIASFLHKRNYKNKQQFA